MQGDIIRLRGPAAAKAMMSAHGDVSREPATVTVRVCIKLNIGGTWTRRRMRRFTPRGPELACLEEDNICSPRALQVLTRNGHCIPTLVQAGSV
jgi:hypothetical protein